LRATVVALERRRALTPGMARTILRAAYDTAPPQADAPATGGAAKSLNGGRADMEAAGYDPLRPKPLSSDRPAHPASYDQIIAKHVDRVKRKRKSPTARRSNPHGKRQCTDRRPPGRQRFAAWRVVHVYGRLFGGVRAVREHAQRLHLRRQCARPGAAARRPAR